MDGGRRKTTNIFFAIYNIEIMIAAMKTGTGVLEHDSLSLQLKESLVTTVSLFIVFQEECVKTAVELAKIRHHKKNGRIHVTEKDSIHALKYQAIMFKQECPNLEVRVKNARFEAYNLLELPKINEEFVYEISNNTFLKTPNLELKVCSILKMWSKFQPKNFFDCLVKDLLDKSEEEIVKNGLDV